MLIVSELKGYFIDNGVKYPVQLRIELYEIH